MEIEREVVSERWCGGESCATIEGCDAKGWNVEILEAKYRFLTDYKPWESHA